MSTSISLSEAKFQIQQLLMDQLGLSASVHMDSVDKAKNRDELGTICTEICKKLDAAKKNGASQALSKLWALNLRGKLDA
jgi:hypothetical protein